MFGCLTIYIVENIVLALRDKLDDTADNGVWLATTKEHNESLRREFPYMRSIQVLGSKVTGSQVFLVDAPDFEEAALRACDVILARDPRIGKLPGARRAASGTNKPRGPGDPVKAPEPRREQSARSRDQQLATAAAAPPYGNGAWTSRPQGSCDGDFTGGIRLPNTTRLMRGEDVMAGGGAWRQEPPIGWTACWALAAWRREPGTTGMQTTQPAHLPLTFDASAHMTATHHLP